MIDKEIKYSFIKKALDQRIIDHSLRSLISIENSLNNAEIEIDGKTFINFCSNDYLGLASHPAVIKRSKEYLEKYGAGSSSSRLISGTHSIHSALEEKLASTFGFESALLFNSGFQANLSIISAIVDRNSLILMDKKCHNSLVNGAILSRATIKRYQHNDVKQLESLLENAKGISYNRILILTETVFSMDGDCNTLTELIGLSNKYNALLYSDDAHAIGVLGDRGLGLNYKKDGIDFNLGTFGKSFGGFGAFIGCSRLIKEYLINFASGFIYTTALPPAIIGGLDAALDLIPTMNKERMHLFDLIQLLKSDLKNSYEILHSESQIIPIVIGSELKTLKLSKHLQDNGLWVSSIRPPTVEKGASRLRITLTALHTKEQVKYLIKTLNNWLND